MTNIILSGALGKMGRAVYSLVSERDNLLIAAGIDISPDPSLPFPIYTDPGSIKEQADVIIDFSHPSVLAPLLEFIKLRRLPAVICTTGLSSEQVQEIKEVSKTVPIFFSANMSLGVNLLLSLSKTAAKILGGSFDIEIVEQHHSHKLDSPSGTALMLADGISGALPEHMQYVYDRHSRRAPRGKAEIGIHSVRGGTIVGEHEVIFAGPDEVLTLSHSASSKAVFASGAVSAAAFLVQQKPGLYDMGDLVSKDGNPNA